ILIFAGFSVLLLRTLVLWGRGYDPDFDFWGILAHGTPLGDGYSLLKDLFAFLVVIGVAVFLVMRLVLREARLTLSIEGLVILAIIFTMMAADLLYDGSAQILEARGAGEEIRFRLFEPGGSMMARVLLHVRDDGVISTLERMGFWTHASLVLIFL